MLDYINSHVATDAKNAGRVLVRDEPVTSTVEAIVAKVAAKVKGWSLKASERGPSAKTKLDTASEMAAKAAAGTLTAEDIARFAKTFGV